MSWLSVTECANDIGCKLAFEYGSLWMAIYGYECVINRPHIIEKKILSVIDIDWRDNQKSTIFCNYSVDDTIVI